MKATVSVSALSNVLSLAASPVETKSTIPLLTHFRCEITNDGRLVALGTAWDRNVEASCPVTDSEPGSVAIPAAMFEEVVSGLDKNAEAVISVEDEVLTLLSKNESGKKLHYRLRTLDPENLPIIPEPEGAVSVQVDAKTLLAALNATQYAAEHSKARFYLQGVCFKATDDGLDIVACDGNRLALWSVSQPPEDRTSLIPTSIVPLEVAEDIARVCGVVDGDLELVFSKGSMAVKFASGCIIARLIDGEFPPYQRVVPAKKDASLRVDRDALLAAADRSTVVFSGLAKAIPTVRFTTRDGMLIMESGTGDAFHEEIEAEIFASEIAFALRAQYVIDVASVFPKGAKLDIQLGDHMQAIRVCSEAHPEMVHVIMPTAR
jgi:DNA polymerase-3 subunit beta